MAKIIRLTEGDLTNIVKRVIKEQGGYDDPGVMATHGGIIQGGARKMIAMIKKMLDDTREAFEVDVPKEQVMVGIQTISTLLDQIEEQLKKVIPEMMLNDDLKLASKNLVRSIKSGKAKLRMLSSGSQSTAHPMMPPAMQGIGFSLDKNDLNDKLTDILIKIGTAAERLQFQLEDEGNRMNRRLMRHGGFG
jgi:hypothetical protein